MRHPRPILFLILGLPWLFGCHPQNNTYQNTPSQRQGSLFTTNFSSLLRNFCMTFEYIDKDKIQVNSTPYAQAICLIPQGFLLMSEATATELQKLSTPPKRVLELYAHIFLYKFDMKTGWLESDLSKFPEDAQTFSNLLLTPTLDPSLRPEFLPAPKMIRLYDQDGTALATVSFQSIPPSVLISALPQSLKDHPESPKEIRISYEPTRNRTCADVIAASQLTNHHHTCQELAP